MRMRVRYSLLNPVVGFLEIGLHATIVSWRLFHQVLADLSSRPPFTPQAAWHKTWLTWMSSSSGTM